MRRKSRTIKIGNVYIGGENPIAVQSMLSIKANDIEGNIKQALEIEKAGCDILRVAVPNMESIELVKRLKEVLTIPLVADIHFDYRLALAAADAGIDKIRINPGNIGSDDKVKLVAEKCLEKQIPIRIGVNAGSVEKFILKKYGEPSAEAMVESALYHAALLEKYNFYDIVISIKSHDVKIMMDAYRMLADKCDYPLHLGVTHTGVPKMGVLKSAMGIGGLLGIGIGDTFRVSLTAPPVEEVILGREILDALGMGSKVQIISCPTCGRCNTDIFGLTAKVEEALKQYDFPITVAVMGCVVNGPGEANEADIGITSGGNGKFALFLKGEIARIIPEENAMEELIIEVEKLKAQREG